jgi:hypothetical protein
MRKDSSYKKESETITELFIGGVKNIEDSALRMYFNSFGEVKTVERKKEK